VIRIVDYINTTHDTLDMETIVRFASHGGNTMVTLLEPFDGFEEGVAVAYEPCEGATKQDVKEAFIKEFNKED
jgi:hypothetical protein